MRMSAAELVARHKPLIAISGATVRIAFSGPGAAANFLDELSLEASEIPRGATRLIRTISLQEGPEPHRAILELVDGDGRAHRFFVHHEDLVRLVATPIVSAPTTEGTPADTATSAAKAEARDDLLELAHIHTRLDRADDRIRRQQRQINTIMATYVERAHLPTGRFPSYCCQRCGEQIGWVGRFFQTIRVPLHACRVEREGA